MPKVKTTRHDLLSRFVVINVPRPCERLLDNPNYYCTRLEGWAFDAQIVYCEKYDVNIAFVWGYASLGKLNVRRLIVDVFNNSLRKNWHTNWSYKQKDAFKRKQLQKFAEVAYYNAVVKGKRGR